MGSIGGMLGLAGGSGGTGFSTGSATNNDQINNSYNANQTALQGQQGLLNAIQGQNGLGNQSQVYNQYQGMVNGQGPNPAQNMLSQATGANVANQAALMAGQRGAGSNVGLMARQAAQQGANTQQQAAGQAATMQANQSLNALGQAGSMANTMAANQIGQTNANTTAQQNEQNMLIGAHNANNAVQGNLAGTTMAGQQALVGGLMNSAGAMAGMASGGEVGDSAFTHESMFGQAMSKGQDSTASYNPNTSGASTLQKGAGSYKGSPKGDPMAGATNIAPSGFSESPSVMPTMVAAKGGSVGDKLKSGGHVPGQAKVKGNSYANDTVKALLSPGEVVIPRSVMQSGDPARGAADFVRAVMAKKGKK